MTVDGILKEIESTKTFSEVCKIEKHRIKELGSSGNITSSRYYGSLSSYKIKAEQ